MRRRKTGSQMSPACDLNVNNTKQYLLNVLSQMEISPFSLLSVSILFVVGYANNKTPVKWLPISVTTCDNGNITSCHPRWDFHFERVTVTGGGCDCIKVDWIGDVKVFQTHRGSISWLLIMRFKQRPRQGSISHIRQSPFHGRFPVLLFV